MYDYKQAFVSPRQLFASSFLSIAEVVKNITSLHIRAADNSAVDLPHSAFKVRSHDHSMGYKPLSKSRFSQQKNDLLTICDTILVTYHMDL